MQIYRIFGVVVALVFCYFAVQFGDALHYYVAKYPNGTGFLGIVAAIVIMLGISFAVAGALDLISDSAVAEIYLTVISGLGFGFLFGLFSGSATAWGPYPWYWLQSKTAILLVFALLPPVYLLIKCGVEALEARRARAGSSVTPFNRTGTK